MVKYELLFTATEVMLGWDAGRKVGKFYKKLRTELSYLILLLGVYIKHMNTLIQNGNMCNFIHKSTIYNSQDLKECKSSIIDAAHINKCGIH